MTVMKLANNIEYWRKRRGLTQDDLALSLGTTKQNISRIERADYIGCKRLESMCNALNCTPNELLLPLDSAENKPS